MELRFEDCSGQDFSWTIAWNRSQSLKPSNIKKYIQNNHFQSMAKNQYKGKNHEIQF